MMKWVTEKKQMEGWERVQCCCENLLFVEQGQNLDHKNLKRFGQGETMVEKKTLH